MNDKEKKTTEHVPAKEQAIELAGQVEPTPEVTEDNKNQTGDGALLLDHIDEIMLAKDKRIAQQENDIADLRAMMAKMGDQFADLLQKKNEEIIEKTVDTLGSLEDDRLETVTYVYKTKQGPRYIQSTKTEALQGLVDWFSNKQSKNVDSELWNPETNSREKVNGVACFIRLRRRDLGSNKYITKLEEVPLWIAAQRALEGQDVALVTKLEYDKYMEEKNKSYLEWEERFLAHKKSALEDKRARVQL